ncbi:MAG: 50S ribosomal protein L29, partial [Patescibacteria group bacterium]
MKLKAKELRQKSVNELQLMLREAREKARSLKFDLASKKVKNPKEIGQWKKQIAQVLTILNQGK